MRGRHLSILTYSWIYLRVIYIESIVDISTLHEHIVKPLIKEAALIQHNFNDFIDRMDRGDILSVPFQRSSSADYIANMIVEGTAVVVVEQLAEAYLFDIALYQKRAVSESQNELVVNGPQEAFIEDIGTNLSRSGTKSSIRISKLCVIRLVTIPRPPYIWCISTAYANPKLSLKWTVG